MPNPQVLLLSVCLDTFLTTQDYLYLHIYFFLFTSLCNKFKCTYVRGGRGGGAFVTLPNSVNRFPDSLSLTLSLHIWCLYISLAPSLSISISLCNVTYIHTYIHTWEYTRLFLLLLLLLLLLSISFRLCGTLGNTASPSQANVMKLGGGFFFSSSSSSFFLFLFSYLQQTGADVTNMYIHVVTRMYCTYRVFLCVPMISFPLPSNLC